LRCFQCHRQGRSPGDPAAITYPYDSDYVVEPILWEAEDAYRFAFSGLWLSSGPRGNPISSNPMNPRGWRLLDQPEGIVHQRRRCGSLPNSLHHPADSFEVRRDVGHSGSVAEGSKRSSSCSMRPSADNRLLRPVHPVERVESSVVVRTNGAQSTTAEVALCYGPIVGVVRTPVYWTPTGSTGRDVEGDVAGAALRGPAHRYGRAAEPARRSGDGVLHREEHS